MLHTGVDLVEIDRIENAIRRHGRRFLVRVFTATERQQCCGRMESLAGRFAAKEAVAKALGTGVWRHNIGWTDIEIVRDSMSGAPNLRLHGAADRRARQMGLVHWSISLTHSRAQAIAFAVAMAG